MEIEQIPEDLRSDYEYGLQLLANMGGPDGYEGIWDDQQQKVGRIERITDLTAEVTRLRVENEALKAQTHRRRQQCDAARDFQRESIDGDPQ